MRVIRPRALHVAQRSLLTVSVVASPLALLVIVICGAARGPRARADESALLAVDERASASADGLADADALGSLALTRLRVVVSPPLRGGGARQRPKQQT